MRDLDSLDADATLTHVSRLRTAADRLEADILSAACHWADLHGTVGWRSGGGLLPGTERLEIFGGDGTPEVAGFAPAELGARAGRVDVRGDAADRRRLRPATPAPAAVGTGPGR